jgi:hypothetical protein
MAIKQTVLLAAFAAVVGFTLPAAVLGQGEKARARKRAGGEDRGKADKSGNKQKSKQMADSLSAKPGGDPAGDQKGELQKGAIKGRYLYVDKNKKDHENRGLALGQDKAPGEGLALGKNKAPGEGLALGKGGEPRGRARVPQLDPEEVRMQRKIQHKMRIKKQREGLKKSKRHQAHLKSGLKKNNPIADEQKKHLRRIARLRRLAAIARESDNMPVSATVRALIQKESSRHDRAMKKLQGPGKGDLKWKD